MEQLTKETHQHIIKFEIALDTLRECIDHIRGKVKDDDIIDELWHRLPILQEEKTEVRMHFLHSEKAVDDQEQFDKQIEAAIEDEEFDLVENDHMRRHEDTWIHPL